MSTMPIDVMSKSFWVGYVTTAQEDAALYLGAKADEGLREAAVKVGHIRGGFRPVVLNYTDNSWNWGSHNITNYAAPKLAQPLRKETKEEKEAREKEEQETTAKWVGGGLLLAAAGLVGYAYKNFSRQQETLNYTTEVSQKLSDAQMSFPDLKTALTNLVNRQIKIDTLNAGKIRNYFCSAVGLAISGASLALGGFQVTPFWTIKAGYIGALASAAFALFNWGTHSSDQEEIRAHYMAILGNECTNGFADQALQQLNLHSENINFPPLHAEGYSLPIFQSIYPGCYNSEFYPAASAPPVGL